MKGDKRKEVTIKEKQNKTKKKGAKWLPQSSFVYPWAPGLKTCVQPEYSVRKKTQHVPFLSQNPHVSLRWFCLSRGPPSREGGRAGPEHSLQGSRCWWGLASCPPEGCSTTGWWCFPSPPLPGGRHYSWKPSMGASGCWKMNCCCVSSTWGARLPSSSSTPK